MNINFVYLLFLLSIEIKAGKIWHITDVHVDPWYIEGSDSKNCYCETTKSCPRMDNCDKTGDAGKFGHSEGNCATPKTLYLSALEMMKE